MALCGKRLLVFGFMALAPFVAKKSWEWNVEKQGFRKTFQAKTTVERVVNSLNYDTATKKEREVLKAFKAELVRVNGNSLTVCLAFIGALSIAVVVVMSSHRERLSFLGQTSILWIALVIYLFGMLLLYFYSFSYREATCLASFSRYTKTYALGMFIGILPYLLSVRSLGKWKSFIKIGSLTGLAMLFSCIIIKPSFVFAAQPLLPMRTQVKERSALVHKNVKDHSKSIYFLGQSASGDALMFARYELMPFELIKAPASLGKKAGAEDYWTKDISQEEFIENIAKADYMLIGSTDEKFWKTYGDTFLSIAGNKKDLLYEVVKERENVRLIPINHTKEPATLSDCAANAKK